MDMSFTKDPNWIRQREVLWKGTVEKFDIATELSPKQLKTLHHYFMTGELSDGEPNNLWSRLFYFPAMSIEAVAHVLKHNLPEGPTAEDVETLKIFFCSPIEVVPGLAVEDALAIFKYIYGEIYIPDWELPFFIGNDTTRINSQLNPHIAFECGTLTTCWLTNDDCPRGMWSYLMDYWFSTLPFVDSIVFRTGDRSRRVEGVVLKMAQRKIRKLLGVCAHGVDPTNGAPDGEERRLYMQAFRERMESLSGPGDLLALWQAVKNADPEEFR